jgi:hypothetical protein
VPLDDIGISADPVDEENFVLGSVVLYASPRDAEFKPDAESKNGLPVSGTLYLSYGAQFDVGDGQQKTQYLA